MSEANNLEKFWQTPVVKNDEEVTPMWKIGVTGMREYSEKFVHKVLTEIGEPNFRKHKIIQAVGVKYGIHHSTIGGWIDKVIYPITNARDFSKERRDEVAKFYLENGKEKTWQKYGTAAKSHIVSWVKNYAKRSLRHKPEEKIAAKTSPRKSDIKTAAFNFMNAFLALHKALSEEDAHGDLSRG